MKQRTATLTRERAPAPAIELSHDRSQLLYPFTLGVASGDPLPGSVVLWTRLAPRPDQPDGGMSSRSRPVAWELALDDAFARVIARGTALAHAQLAHSVHVEVTGLLPGVLYFYRFACAGHVSETGRTRTAPAEVSHHEGVRFAIASAAPAAGVPFSAYDAIARDDLDLLVLWAGQTLVNAAPPSRLAAPGVNPALLGAQRVQQALWLTDPDVQAARRAMPWIVALDAPTGQGNEHAELVQASWEHAPIRRARLSRTGAPDSSYRFSWGDLTDLTLHADGSERPRATVRRAARAPWSFILDATGRPTHRDRSPGVTLDAELLCRVARAKLRNPVLLGRSTDGASLSVLDGQLGPSASGRRVPHLLAPPIGALSGRPLDPNPMTRVLFGDARPGYLRCDATHTELRVDFLVVSETSRRGRALDEVASFVLEDGCPEPRRG